MNAVVQEKTAPAIRWIRFRLADAAYGINAMQVRQVLRMTDMVNISPRDIEPAPAAGTEQALRCTHGTYGADAQMLFLIDLNKLSSDENRVAIAIS